MGDTQFHFRIRCSPRSCQKSHLVKRYEDEVPLAYRSDPAHFYGFAYFRQVKDPSIQRGYFQKSVVLVSRLPYVNLFSEVVSNKSVIKYFSVRVPSRGDKPGAVSSPDNPLVAHIVPQMPSPKVIPTLKDPDIFRCLQSVLPHIHLLWELALTNEPIVVMAPSPTICSETVQALASLISPLHYCSDYRPFFTIHDTEFKEYTTRTQAPPGVILGVTNPFFAKTLQHWPHMVRIGEMSNLVISSRKSPGVGQNAKRTLSSKPGIYTKYKQLLTKDKLIFRRLSKVCIFVLFFNCLRCVGLPAYFSCDKIINNSLCSDLTQKIWNLTSTLYCYHRKFFKSANFEGWLRHRQQEIRQKLEILHLEALGKADVPRWIRDKQEVEIVDLFLQIKEKLAGSASFYPPVSLEIKQQLKGHLLSIIRTLPEDLQFVLKNS
ncbi:protein DENND6A-like [Orbicella faveolata]|uniref:protein DENND6A-like n=1 Tax=Orbicella faveolata TaxID=48498 RepID=UPI0009E51A5F|nr:protein DENND6A-like [Orbicella faveolata]